ncbi:MAG: RdgB/HAM1 family non-canonical purine NTP pyrophosphatase [Gloeobacterales cyanobacterium]
MHPNYKNLVLASGNPGKLKELQNYLEPTGWRVEAKPTDLEPEETGATFSENARIKAQAVATFLGKPALADDSGLEVRSLAGRPGVHSARYGPNDQGRINRLLAELKDQADRSARFVCALCIVGPDGSVWLETEGICEGEILTEPRGTGGFGYDPVFYVPQLDKTFAQLTSEEKLQYSHRGKALSALKEQWELLLRSTPE